jgi:hypothetical protein
MKLTQEPCPTCHQITEKEKPTCLTCESTKSRRSIKCGPSASQRSGEPTRRAQSSSTFKQTPRDACFFCLWIALLHFSVPVSRLNMSQTNLVPFDGYATSGCREVRDKRETLKILLCLISLFIAPKVYAIRPLSIAPPHQPISAQISLQEPSSNP